MTDILAPDWQLDIGPTRLHGEPMPICAQCRTPIRGDWDRIDAGVLLGAGGPNPVRVDRDLDFCSGDAGCMGEWFMHRYPWLVKVREVAAA